MESNIDLFGRCPYVTAQKVLAGKWSLVILYHLCCGTHRFNELQKKMPDLTQTTLTKHLRSLEKYGMIIRKVYPEVPPKVEYSLSEVGKEFKTVLDSIENWGNQYVAYLNKSKR